MTLDPTQLSALLGMPLTQEQLVAVTAPATPGLVVAGAGSGKTTVMAARVVWLVANEGIQPERALGLTFTNKAAAELAARVRQALRRWCEHTGADDDHLEPTVSTYHAYAARLVHDHGLRLGLEPDARLLTDATRFQLAERVVRDAEGPFGYLSSWIPGIVDGLLALDAELREHLVEPEAVAEHARRTIAEIDDLAKPRADCTTAREKAYERLDLLQLVSAYRSAKRDRSCMDFGDLIAFAAELATVADVRDAERACFDVVLLDEYQDTSIAQSHLLRELFGQGHPVTAVGDPLQAIYGWRGASVQNIAQFVREFARSAGADAARFTLAQNNRSGGRLVEVANHLAQPLRQTHFEVPVLRARPGRMSDGHTRVGLFETYAAEVRFLANDIADRLQDQTPPGDVAVLVRVGADLAAVHAALSTAGVPVEVVGLSGLLELPEIVDVVSTLQVLDDPTANVAMLRLLTGPRWRIGVRDLTLLGRRAQTLLGDTGQRRRSEDDVPRDLERALLEAVAGVDACDVPSLLDAVIDPGPLPYDPEAVRRFAALAQELASLRRHVGEPVDDLCHRVIDRIGVLVEVASGPDASAHAVSPLVQLGDVAAQFVGVDDDRSLTAFLAYLEAARDHERGLDAALPTPTDAVTLMTVHKAKGLEWPVVYVAGLSKTVFPNTQGRSSWLTKAAVLPDELRGDAADLPEAPEWSRPGIKAYQRASRKRDEIEERRLAYVALTRAGNDLCLTGSWWGPTQVKARGPSPYLEAVHELLGGDPSLGSVVAWVEPPVEGSTNPALDARGDGVWPVVPDADARAQRHEAARLVADAALRMRQGSDDSGSQVSAQDAATIESWDRDLLLLLQELRTARDPMHEVELPHALTASQVVRLQADPDRFARELLRPMPAPPAPAARRGTAFHRWVEERFDRPALLDLDDLESVDRDLLDGQLEQLKQAFRTGPYADRRPLEVEAPFELAVGGHIVRGRIDAVYRLPPNGSTVRYEVVDWKTGQRAADPLQLAIYRAAWAARVGCDLAEVDAVFYAVGTGEVQRFPDLPDAQALARQLSTVAEP